MRLRDPQTGEVFEGPDGPVPEGYELVRTDTLAPHQNNLTVVPQGFRHLLDEAPEPVKTPPAGSGGDVSWWEGFGRGAAQGATLGGQARLSAGAEALLRALTGNENFQTYDEAKAYYDKVNRRAREVQPGAYTGGAIFGGAPLAVATGGGSLGVNAALGGATGALSSEADSAEGLIGDILTGAGWGAVGYGGSKYLSGGRLQQKQPRPFSRKRVGPAKAPPPGEEVPLPTADDIAAMKKSAKDTAKVREPVEALGEVEDPKLAEAYGGRPKVVEQVAEDAQRLEKELASKSTQEHLADVAKRKAEIKSELGAVEGGDTLKTGGGVGGDTAKAGRGTGRITDTTPEADMHRVKDTYELLEELRKSGKDSGGNSGALPSIPDAGVLPVKPSVGDRLRNLAGAVKVRSLRPTRAQVKGMNKIPGGRVGVGRRLLDEESSVPKLTRKGTFEEISALTDRAGKEIDNVVAPYDVKSVNPDFVLGRARAKLEKVLSAKPKADALKRASDLLAQYEEELRAAGQAKPSTLLRIKRELGEAAEAASGDKHYRAGLRSLEAAFRDEIESIVGPKYRAANLRYAQLNAAKKAAEGSYEQSVSGDPLSFSNLSTGLAAGGTGFGVGYLLSKGTLPAAATAASVMTAKRYGPQILASTLNKAGQFQNLAPGALTRSATRTDIMNEGPYVLELLKKYGYPTITDPTDENQ